MTRFLTPLFFVFIFIFTTQSLLASPSSSTLFSLFVNSLRRDPVGVEAENVVRVGTSAGPNCSAFYLKNSSNQVLLGSAKHCFNYEFKEKCQNKEIIIYSQDYQEIGLCQQVLIESKYNDFVVFKAKLKSTIKNIPQGLSLAKYDPAPGTALKEIGFPADDFRKAKITVSENCWVLGTPYRYLTLPERWNRDGARETTTRILPHNCSTYGGNSGGPMTQSGTMIVLGLPDSYRISDYNLYPAQNSSVVAEFSSMNDFVSQHKNQIERLKIDIVETSPINVESPSFNYLKEVKWGKTYVPTKDLDHACAFIPRWKHDQTAIETEFVSHPDLNCSRVGIKIIWTCPPSPNHICTHEMRREIEQGKFAVDFEYLSFQMDTFKQYQGIYSAQEVNSYLMDYPVTASARLSRFDQTPNQIHGFQRNGYQLTPGGY